MRRVDEIEALYAQLPALACKGLCSQSCGPIECSNLERKRARKAGGGHIGLKYLDIEAIKAGHDVPACPALEETRCSVYAVRPMICRLYGMVQDRLECPHGCEPERWLDPEEASWFLAEAARIGGAPQ